MVIQFEASRAASNTPGHRRQAAFVRRHTGRGAADLRPQQATGQRRDIAIEHHLACRQRLCPRQRDAADSAPGKFDAADLAAEAIGHAERFTQALQRSGQGAHAALDQPDTVLLDVGDQHECGRRQQGG